MNANDIFDGITDIRDDLIEEAKTATKKPKSGRRTRWFSALAAVLAIVLLVGVFLRPGNEAVFFARAEAVYPDESTWYQYHDKLGDLTNIRRFFSESTQTFLTDAAGENRVYSPLNVYMALTMLAQVTDGASQAQILNLLGSDSMDTLRDQASNVWNATYRNDENTKTTLANSLWISDEVALNQDTLDLLARALYASTYQGKTGSKKFDRELQGWLNEQTGGFLEEQVKNVGLNPQAVLALASAVYFRAPWSDAFSEADTVLRAFHTSGGDQEIAFMRRSDAQVYYRGDRFSAVEQSLYGSGGMMFLLPDEGVTPENLLSDPQVMDFLFSGDGSGGVSSETRIVHKSIPRFDVDSQYDLADGLKTLGVTDIFDYDASDFSPITGDPATYIAVEEINHAERVAIDEKGCTGAAYTVVELPGEAAPPDEEVDFVLDRPFLFCVTSASGLPLFVGIVNNPVG